MRLWLVFLAISLLAMPGLAELSPSYITFPSDIDWVTKSTDHFTVLYRRGENTLADRTLLAAENAHTLLAPIFPQTPSRTWIVLADFHDALNGYAIDYPYPHFVVFVSPPEPSGQLAALDRWLESVVLHEYVHVLHLYPANSGWSFLRALFGSWVLPNGLMPSHLHEGLATFLETEFTQGGRGKGPAFSMFRRMAVKQGVWGKEFVPLDLLEGSSVHWPMFSSPYFFGYYLYEELWYKKKAAGIRSFVDNTSRAWPYWIQRPVTKTYGMDYPTLWKSIFEKNREAASREIRAIEQRPLSALHYLTNTYFTKWAVAVSPDGKWIAYRREHPDMGSTIEIHPVEQPEAAISIEVETGHQENLCWASKENRFFLLYAETDSKDGYSLNALRVYNVDLKKKIIPRFEGKPIRRVHAIGCGTKSVLTYQEHGGHGTVREWMVSSDWETWQVQRQWEVPTGNWVTSLVAATPPLLSIRRRNSTAIYRWAPGQEPKETAEIAGYFYGFSFALPSGEWPAIGTVTGRQEVWAFDFKKHWARKIIGVLGGVNSFDRHGNRWWVSSYRHGGFDIAQATPFQTPAEIVHLSLHEPIRTPAAATPSLSEERGYSPWSTLYPRAWFPSILVVPNGIQFGAWIPGFDISQRHVYSLFGGYDTRGSPFFTTQYSYRFGTSQQFNAELDFLPLYLITSRNFMEQWYASVGFSTGLGKNLPRIALSFIFKRLEASHLGPAIQSVGVNATANQTFFYKTFPRAIAPGRATQLYLSHSQYFQALGSQDNFFSLTAGLDQYLHIPWTARHTIKVAAKFGYTSGTAFYNSFFQGGGELIFSSGRFFFLNRGFLPGTFASQRLLSFNLDYLFPLVEVERGWSQSPFFLKRLDGAITADATTGGSFRKYYWSAGFELKTYWKLFFYLPACIRVGLYHGFGPFGQPIYGTMAVEASL